MAVVSRVGELFAPESGSPAVGGAVGKASARESREITGGTQPFPQLPRK